MLSKAQDLDLLHANTQLTVYNILSYTLLKTHVIKSIIRKMVSLCSLLMAC